MTDKEKAKAYDEAIERGKQIQTTPYTAHWDIMKEVAEHLLPELKEGESERIRKELIQYLKECNNLPNGQYCRADFFAWLEKQGEKKPSDKIEPKFKVGQIIKKEGFNLRFAIVKIEDGFYYDDMGGYFPFTNQDDWELVEQKPAWKPSEEQMKALNDITVTGCISYAEQGQELINLYNDLKKLREE